MGAVVPVPQDAPMTDHDQRFKALLREFFPEFLRLFFPEQAARFDFARIEWLDKELSPDPPQGGVFVLDLVARLRLHPPEGGTAEATAEAVALVHVEVESRDAVAAFRKRMYQYYESLRRRYDCPVLPVAVYLRVGLDGIGIDRYAEDYGDLEVLRFQYLYVGLPALDAEQYVAGGSWLGVALAALMRIPRGRRAWLRSESLRRILVECRENDYRRFLLCECVEAYLTLDEEQQREYQRLLHTEPYREIEPMMMTTYEKGMEKGQRKSVQVLLEHRFGPLSPTAVQRLEEWPAERLTELLIGVLNAPSLQALGLED
jgi:hypothetical protein